MGTRETAMHNITMPPRLNLYGASRSLAFRSRPSIISYQSRISPAVSRRAFADEKTPPTGPNEETLGHVSEEAADMSKIKGETGPDLGQGTPVQEIIERDQESKEKAPEIVKEEIEKTKSQADAADTTSFANLLALGQLQNVATGGHATDPVNLGHKFGLPDLPLPSDGNLKYRYDPVVSQVTTLLMKHGKLSVAQRNMSFILNQLRTAPPPTTSPTHPLLPGAPPPNHLPLNPLVKGCCWWRSRSADPCSPRSETTETASSPMDTRRSQQEEVER